MKNYWKLAALAAMTAFLSACGGGGGGSPTLVATGPTAVTMDATTGPAAVQAVSGQTLAFSGGVPDFGTAGTPTNLTITTGSSSTFSVTAGGNSASGDMSFGSCIFTVRTSSFVIGSPLATGSRIVVSPCSVTLATTGVPANGTPAAVGVTLNLNGAISAPINQTISINGAGVITINNTVVTTTKVAPLTGA